MFPLVGFLSLGLKNEETCSDSVAHQTSNSSAVSTPMQPKLSLRRLSARHGLDQSSAGPQLLIKPLPASLSFILTTYQLVSSIALPPFSAVADSCLPVDASESLNKSACNREEEEEEERRKMATGETVSISCR